MSKIDKKIISIIPAKSISRRLKNKNTLELNGKPLFQHSVELALDSKYINEIYVSSDSKKILNKSKNLGVKSIERPKSLCNSYSTNMHVCEHVLNTLKIDINSFSYIVLLQPTQPFRRAEELDKAILTFFKNDEFSSLVTVAKNERKTGYIKNDKFNHLSKITNNTINENNLFFITGHLYIFKPENIINKKNLLGKTIYPFMLPDSWIDIDIDTQKDFILAQDVAKLFFEQ